jgi:hypothetical protein
MAGELHAENNAVDNSAKERSRMLARHFSFLLIVLVLCAVTGGVLKADTFTYVGSFNVSDGPYWTSVPAALSATQVAALLFGGVFSDYEISVNPSQDPSTITHTAHLDGYADAQYLFTPAPQDFGGSTDGLYDHFPAYSAYVCDHADCTAQGGPDRSLEFQGADYTNYVWRDVPTVDGAVPEPTSIVLLATVFGFVGVALRRRFTA